MPFLVTLAAAAVVLWHYFGVVSALPAVLPFAFLFLIFRDPHRPVPAVPLGVVSPVDGVILDVSVTDKSALGGEAQTISIRVNSLGTYTARCPVEGKIMDISSNGDRDLVMFGSGGLWVQTDESDDVVLRFRGHRFGLPPKAFMRYGERVGQGQRCAFLRLTRVAEVQVPLIARVQVKAGQTVTAGSDVLARLPHH
jgi:phosphatidylserine decarboxylase